MNNNKNRIKTHDSEFHVPNLQVSLSHQNWLIDFNGISTWLCLFYAQRLGKRVHIYIFV